AELMLPAITNATNDPDTACRVQALGTLQVLALYAPESEKLLSLRRILEATRDGDDSVRTAALESLLFLGYRDTSAVVAALRTAVEDRSVDVRRMAARQLGRLSYFQPEIRSDAATILSGLLAGREESSVRTQAAWGLWWIGRGLKGAAPDVVPALV